jgi:hypothetical protein
VRRSGRTGLLAGAAEARHQRVAYRVNQGPACTSVSGCDLCPRTRESEWLTRVN